MTKGQRTTGLAVSALIIWEVLSSLAFVYALPFLVQLGAVWWFGRFTVPPDPFVGVLQYLAPLLHGHAISNLTLRAIGLSLTIGAAGIALLYLLWLRAAWAWRFRRPGQSSWQ